MLFKALFSSSLLASAVLGHTIDPRATVQRCGAPKPNQDQISIAQGFAEKEAAARKGDGRIAAAPINVNVYVHVVSTSTSAADGYLSVSRPLELMMTKEDSWALGRSSFRMGD